MTRRTFGSAAAEHLPIDHVDLSVGVALALIASPVGEAIDAIYRFWTEGLGPVRVEIGDEHVVRLADGSARIVAEVTVGRCRVVATLLGATAPPGEWAVRRPEDWPS